MDMNTYKLTKKEITKKLAITAIFNTLFALVLFYLVLDKNKFFHVFMISQFIGLSICLFVTTAMHFGSRKGIKGLIAGIIFGLIAGILFGSFISWLFMYFTEGMGIDYFLKDVFLYTFVFGIVFGVPAIYFFSSWTAIQESEKQIQQEKIKRLTIEKESAMTTLRLLQAQIEPHFLFNTLSNVVSLFEIDTDKAKTMLIDINEYLRISLQRTRQNMIFLDQELELVKRYLDIFQIRMGKRLSYTISDRTGTGQIPFPPMIIQPLVENSIKYGLEPKEDGGTITIECSIEDGKLKIIVADTGKGLDQDANQAGIGINNVSTRLENIYGDKGSLVLKENRPSGIKAIIEVPYGSS